MTDADRRLIFVIGPPRGGTTLLLRLLHAHSQIQGAPEPHLLTPLAHLGYFDRVDKAPYDPFQTALGQRALVEALPGGEQAYVDALRACTDRLYDGLRQGKARVVDKTPAYALVLPFVERLYPDATYVVLTRHPFAVFSSYARSFFDDDWEVAHAHNPIVERYVPAIGRFLRESSAPHRVHVRYEDLVTDPERALAAICAAAELPFEPDMVHYGQTDAPAAGPGDPIGVDRNDRPVTTSADAWASEVKDDPIRRAHLARMIRGVSDEDLAAWGHPRDTLWDPIDAATPTGPRKPPLDRHHLERKLLVALRKNVHHGPLGPVLRRVKFGLDALLRE